MPSAATLARFIARRDRVVVRWVFEFEFLDGSRMRLDELAYQRWDGERIAEEKFFYDPAQLQAAPAVR